MKRYALVLTALLLSAACSPKMRPAPDIKAPADEAAIDRGRYLANHVAACTGCHTERDHELPGYPVKHDRLLAGGAVLTADNLKMGGEGIPAKVLQAPNITPHPEDGIGKWTDGEIVRAIREGVSRDGRPLFPLMPYGQYSKMSDDDVLAIVAYLRSVTAVANRTAPADIKFPMNFIMRTIPRPLEGRVEGPGDDMAARGKYLVTIGVCADCHSPSEKGKPIAGQEFSGGVIMEEHGLVAVTSNLTPDAETGIADVSEEEWLRMFREGVGRDGRPLSPIMPWVEYRGMSDEDLLAMRAYFLSVPAVKKNVMPLLADYASK